MENNKLLWIVLAVSLFLLVVLGIGLVWMQPTSPYELQEPLVDNQLKGTEIGDMVRSSSEHPGLTGEVEAQTGSSFDAETTAVDTTLSVEATAVDPKIEKADKEVVDTIQITKTGTAPSSKSPASAPKSSPPPAKETAAPKPPPASPPPARPAVQPTSWAPESSVPATQYWIQAGAFKSSYHAGLAKEQLSRQGINSTITTKTISGEVYYRVRIGPYFTKSQATGFLVKIKSINGFDESFISKVTGNV